MSAVPAAAGILHVAALDAMTPEDFAAAVAPLFEGAPRFLARLAAERPFESLETLFERARGVAHAMPEAEQVELVDAHPRLGAAPASVSALSFREQGYDTVPRTGPAEQVNVAAAFERLNEAYEARFGFRYCVFVAGRPRHELIEELEGALGRDRAAELRRAVDAVVDIAVDRHAKLMAEA